MKQMTLTRDEYQHKAGACVGITMELICRITKNMREDAIKKQLWRLMDEHLTKDDADYADALESVLSGFVDILDAVGCFTTNQISLIEGTLQSEIEEKFAANGGNR